MLIDVSQEFGARAGSANKSTEGRWPYNAAVNQPHTRRADESDDPFQRASKSIWDTDRDGW